MQTKQRTGRIGGAEETAAIPFDMEEIRKADPEIAAAIMEEYARQEYTLEMIASENSTSYAVMAAQGSLLTNKYAEGYPGRRYYGGCEFVDVAENLAVSRAKELFQAEYVNVQPHSGSQANMGVYFALLEPGDTVLGMDLAHGGHLTHGSHVNFSGRLYRFIHYGVDRETETINMAQVEELAKKHRPKMIVAGASAYPRVIDFEGFSQIAKEIGACFMVDMAHIAGLVAAGIHPSPVPYADVVTTTTHKTLRGPRGGMVLAKEELKKKLDSQIFPGIQGGPLMHVIAAKAIALKAAMEDSFRKYQKQVVENAAHLASCLQKNGLRIVSGGTDNHLMMVDLKGLGITGKDADHALGRADITVNKNAIPFETEKPTITSGIRLGTPTLTTRGMGFGEMETVADLITRVLEDPDNETVIEDTRKEVRRLCEAFPLYR